jgi:hypothetical protein
VLFGSFVQTIIALIQNSGKTSCTFGDLFKISVHARTIPTVIRFVTSFVNIPFVFIINYVIGAVFTYKAIKETVKCFEISKTSEFNTLSANSFTYDACTQNETTYSNSGDYGVNTGFGSQNNDNNN